VSLDPRSLSMAFLTDGLVVKGPGVNSFLSPWLAAMILI